MSTAGKLAWAIVLIVGVVHFDFWAWDDDTLVFGFMPSALAFHAGISIAAAIGWALVVRFDWPDSVEAWASAGDGDSADGEGDEQEREGR